MSSMKEKMHTGELYLPGDQEIVEDQTKRLDRLYDYNMTRPTEGRKREALLKEMLAEVGEGCYIEPPFHSNNGRRYPYLCGRLHDVWPQCYCCRNRTPDSSRAERKAVSIQHAYTYRQKMLDWSRGSDTSWSNDRR